MAATYPRRPTTTHDTVASPLGIHKHPPGRRPPQAGTRAHRRRRPARATSCHDHHADRPWPRGPPRGRARRPRLPPTGVARDADLRRGAELPCAPRPAAPGRRRRRGRGDRGAVGTVPDPSGRPRGVRRLLRSRSVGGSARRGAGAGIRRRGHRRRRRAACPRRRLVQRAAPSRGHRAPDGSVRRRAPIPSRRRPSSRDGSRTPAARSCGPRWLPSRVSGRGGLG